MKMISIAFYLLTALQSDRDSIKRYIKELGSNQVGVRESAESKLKSEVSDAYDQVRTALDNSDPEIRIRAGSLMKSPPYVLETLARGRRTKLGSDSPKEAVSSIKNLLAMDRKALCVSLDRCIAKSHGLQKYRAHQLKAVLQQKATDGLIYGLVPERPEFVQHETVRAIAIWLNVSDRGRACNFITPVYSICILPEKWRLGPGRTGKPLDNRMFYLESGAALVALERIPWNPLKSGSFSLSATCSPVQNIRDVKLLPLQSNTSVVTVRPKKISTGKNR